MSPSTTPGARSFPVGSPAARGAYPSSGGPRPQSRPGTVRTTSGRVLSPRLPVAGGQATSGPPPRPDAPRPAPSGGGPAPSSGGPADPTATLRANARLTPTAGVVPGRVGARRTPPAPSGVHAAVAAAAARLCPGFTAGAVLRSSGRSLLLSGSVSREPVVVKYLADDAPHWVRRFRHEVAAYRTFTRQRPPVRVPRLVAADSERRLLVLEHVPGRPVCGERHPSSAPARDDVRAVLGAFSALGQWRPLPGSFPVGFDYPARVDRYHALGLLTDRDASDLRQLLRSLSRLPQQLCHGDAVLSNVLVTSHGPTLVDWENTAYHLPGYDLAMLWTVLARDPMTRRQIVQTAQRPGSAARDAFLVNLMLVLVREVRLHDGAAGEDHRRLLRRLHDDCAAVRRAVRAAVGTR